MKKILIFIFCLALNNEALAYTFGPIEGGKCDSCDIWIDEITMAGGQVNLGAWLGWGNADRDITDFARRHCIRRGFQEVNPMDRRFYYTGDGFLAKDQAKKFTCSLPDPYLVAEFTSGGIISSSENKVSEIQQLADKNCQGRSLGIATIKPDGTQTYSRINYSFECLQPKFEIPTVNLQANQVELAPKMTLIEAKRRCKEIGFKPKTEKFGGCVLELTE